MAEKREYTAGSSTKESEVPSASKQPRMEARNWCSDCWSPPQDVCRNGHRLVDRYEAVQLTQAELERVQATAKAELERVRARHHDELTRVQSRLSALALARFDEGPVLQATVDPSEDWTGFFMEGGGPLLFKLATTAATAEEKEAVCRELERLEVSFEKFEEKGKLIFGFLRQNSAKALSSLFEKLPNCVPGQFLDPGTALLGRTGLRHDRVKFELYISGGMPWHGEVGTKVFSLLQDEDCDLDKIFEYSICEKYCKPSRECCCATGIPGSTTLSGVKFQSEG